MAAVAKTTAIKIAKELNVPRAKTALKFFHEDSRETYESEHPEQSPREVRAALKDMFSSLDDKEKELYIEKERDDRERFISELREAMLSAGMDLTTLPAPKKKRSKKLKRVTLANALGVKAPRSAFNYFGMKFRADLKKNGEAGNAREVMRLISEKWNEMTDKQKSKYEKMAKKDKARYKKEIEEAKAEHPEIVEENEKANADVRKKRRKNKRVKRAKTAYNCYCAHLRSSVMEDNPDLSPKSITKTLAKMWKKLSDEEKQPYLDEAEEDRERYLREKQDADDNAAAAAGAGDDSGEHTDYDEE